MKEYLVTTPLATTLTHHSFTITLKDGVLTCEGFQEIETWDAKDAIGLSIGVTGLMFRTPILLQSNGNVSVLIWDNYGDISCCGRFDDFPLTIFYPQQFSNGVVSS